MAAEPDAAEIAKAWRDCAAMENRDMVSVVDKITGRSAYAQVPLTNVSICRAFTHTHGLVFRVIIHVKQDVPGGQGGHGNAGYGGHGHGGHGGSEQDISFYAVTPYTPDKGTRTVVVEVQAYPEDACHKWRVCMETPGDHRTYELWLHADDASHDNLPLLLDTLCPENAPVLVTHVDEEQRVVVARGTILSSWYSSVSGSCFDGSEWLRRYVANVDNFMPGFAREDVSEVKRRKVHRPRKIYVKRARQVLSGCALGNGVCKWCSAPKDWYQNGRCKGYILHMIKRHWDGQITEETVTTPCNSYDSRSDTANPTSECIRETVLHDQMSFQPAVYKRVHHLKERMVRHEAVEKTYIPPHILAWVHDYVLFSGDSLSDLTPPRVRQILRNIENCRIQKVCSKYFNSADKITILLGGKYTNPFDHLRVSSGKCGASYSKIIEQYFLRCEQAFESLSETEKAFRKSFPPVDFIIRMCFVHHHWPGGESFKFVQTPKNREIYARLFNLICDYWHWPRVIIPMTGNEVRLEDEDAPAICLPIGVEKIDKPNRIGTAVKLMPIGHAARRAREAKNKS